MIEIKRDVFKNDKHGFGLLHNAIKKIHQPAEHTKKVLLKNRHIKDFCEESRHFLVMKIGGEDMYIHYDVATWIKGNTLPVKIESITIYDDFLEYESARMRGLNSTTDADNPYLN